MSLELRAELTAYLVGAAPGEQAALATHQSLYPFMLAALGTKSESTLVASITASYVYVRELMPLRNLNGLR
jgi:NAD+--asparagine ADP-ribosyltransferase